MYKYGQSLSIIIKKKSKKISLKYYYFILKKIADWFSKIDRRVDEWRKIKIHHWKLINTKLSRSKSSRSLNKK